MNPAKLAGFFILVPCISQLELAKVKLIQEVFQFFFVEHHRDNLARLSAH